MNFNVRIPAKLISAYGSHALRDNPVRDAPASRTAKRFGLHSHAERGNDETLILIPAFLQDIATLADVLDRKFGKEAENAGR